MPNDVDEFRKALVKVAVDFGDDTSISEAELINRWFAAGVFSALGYGTDKDDYRVEIRIPRAGRADLILGSFGQRVRAIVEFKRPGIALSDHVSQLREYADQILPDVAFLTNGKDLWLYVRSGSLPLDPLSHSPTTFDLTSLDRKHSEILFDYLHKVEIDLGSLRAVELFLKELENRPVRVQGSLSPGGKAFLDRFRLDTHSVFGRLVSQFFEALPALQEKSRFTAGAYAFWQRAYAREMSSDKVPKNWKPFLGDHAKTADIQRFMFCLESAYALLARVLLAKAMQDAHFPNLNVIDSFGRSAGNHQSHDRLDAKTYSDIVTEVFSFSGRQAFATLFASDIFDWWQDASVLLDPTHFSNTLAETVLGIFVFDFGDLEGDVLGDLYQKYFDRETRLALGEFYTPPEVVEFILEQVGYSGNATDRGRLLDPACGSGTFIVAALSRYLTAHQNDSPRTVLTRLIQGLHIVGFDINPFATLLAQVNYAVKLLPLYARALEEGPLGLQNLPIYRTDSLRFEHRETETEYVLTQVKSKRKKTPISQGTLGFQLTYQGDMAEIREHLPVKDPQGVKSGRGQFVEVRLPVPRADLARERHLVGNHEEYALALSTLFDAVDAGDNELQLSERLNQIKLPEPTKLAHFMAPALKGIGDTLEMLRTKYGDGRFKKTLRDLAVALVVKNELKYEYVVGNPPYVRVQRLPEELRSYWQNNYAWVHGNFDIYIPFIERALTGWLREGGHLGLICSDRFLVANYAAELRRNICTVARPDLILDLRDTRVFKEALNYPAIFCFTKSSTSDGQFVASRVFSDPDEADVLFKDIRENLEKTHITSDYSLGLYSDSFLLPISDLFEKGWYLMPRDERKIFDAIEATRTHYLQELTATQSGGFQGIATAADDVMVLRLIEDHGDKLLLQPKGGGIPVEIEREAVRPWLFGHDVERWYVDWDRWYVLFPYLKINGQYQLVPSKEYREKFRYPNTTPFIEDEWPGLWGYLQRPEVRKRLQAREDERYKPPSPDRHIWYGLARPQNLDYFERNKIVLQVSSIAPDVALDGTGKYFFTAGGTSGVYGLLLKDEYRRYELLICALLNSKPLDFFLKHISEVYSGRAYSYGDQFLKNLPMKIPINKIETILCEQIGSIAAELTKNKSILRSLDIHCKAFPLSYLSILSPDIDLYSINRLTDGNPISRNFKRDEVIWTTQLDGRPALQAGRSTLVFPTESHAELVRVWLDVQSKSEIHFNDLMQIRIAESEKGCQTLLHAIQLDKKRLVKMQQKIALLEEQVNLLIFRLYGLDLDISSKDIIRDFLNRF